MKKILSVIIAIVIVFAMGSVCFAEDAAPAEAENGTVQTAEEDNSTGMKAIAAAAVVALVAAAGAIGMAIAISKSTEGMARQPEIAGKINSSMMLGLVFIETAIIYALIVAILIIFVL